MLKHQGIRERHVPADRCPSCRLNPLLAAGHHADALEEGVESLGADFNCTVTNPAYVVEILDRLEKDAPETLETILYVEQPFPCDLEAYRMGVRSVSERKPRRTGCR